MLTDPSHRYATAHGLAVAVDRVEAGQLNQFGVTAAAFGVGRATLSAGIDRTKVEVPFPDAILAVAESQ